MAQELIAHSDQHNADTNKIKSWRSIFTLVIFILTNLIVLFPFHVPVFVPRLVVRAILRLLCALRIVAPKQTSSPHSSTRFVRFTFSVNFVSAPLIANLILLAVLAIGRKEVHDGIVGDDTISPLDIMAFFISLAYIAISIDASGLIRYLAFRVLKWGGAVGHRLFLYLYIFFFALASFIGNDPVILSGTAFLAYMTRVSSNIVHPRAWIFTQFAVANIASAILVSSNPTNLVLAGAFGIKFIHYTANIIVPVVCTAIILYPFLLYIVFADVSLIPYSIEMHELPEEVKGRKPVNPNIPHARGSAEELLQEQNVASDEPGKQLLSLEEIMNPFLDKSGAIFGAVLMTATLITLLAVNAASQNNEKHPVFWVTLPSAFIMFCWDIGFGWYNRKETRKIAQKGRQEFEKAHVERAIREEDEANVEFATTFAKVKLARLPVPELELREEINDLDAIEKSRTSKTSQLEPGIANPKSESEADEKFYNEELKRRIIHRIALGKERGPATMVSKLLDAHQWAQETFPTTTTVLGHLPVSLVPFSFCMFILVQALVTQGWVPVFALGWDHWVSKAGTVGAIGGMGFLSVLLSNLAGTNIGTSILLCRVIQAWQSLHVISGIPISNRTFWATVYSAALGLNFGAFSTSFSASLAGLLWRDILARKYIYVHSLDFARVNLPIIAIAMTTGCAVLTGQVYLMRDTSPYDAL